MELILASNSPRRKELLTKAGYSFKVEPATIDEKMDIEKTPYQNVMMVSFNKAHCIYLKHKEDVILGCDTIVCYHGKIFGKPKDRENAIEMLEFLSEKTHEVISGVSIIAPDKVYKFFVTSYVTFKKLSKEQIEKYVDTKEPMDKAGSYAIQGLGRELVDSYKGNLENIIGLPMLEVSEVLNRYFTVK